MMLRLFQNLQNSLVKNDIEDRFCLKKVDN